jgi:alcohol dehydrogenase (NADP+)
MSPTTIPPIGLGTWKSADHSVYNAVRYALEIGYQHLDCAPIYMNEKPIGQAIKDAISAGHIKRQSLWVTSKLWNSFHAYNDAIDALKETLHFMQLDYLDSFLIHWPVAMKKSVGHARAKSHHDFIPLDQAPLESTWEALIECQKQGLTRTIGVSNFSIEKIDHLIKKTGVTPAINQVECHPLLSQQPLLDYCQQHHISLTAYAPLGSNDRPNKMKLAKEPSLLQHPCIQEIATFHHCSTAQVLLAWAMHRGTIVIPKSIQPQHIKNNLDALNLRLQDQEITAINQLNQNYRFIDGRFFALPDSPYTVDSIWK